MEHFVHMKSCSHECNDLKERKNRQGYFWHVSQSQTNSKILIFRIFGDVDMKKCGNKWRIFIAMQFKEIFVVKWKEKLRNSENFFIEVSRRNYRDLFEEFLRGFVRKLCQVLNLKCLFLKFCKSFVLNLDWNDAVLKMLKFSIVLAHFSIVLSLF